MKQDEVVARLLSRYWPAEAECADDPTIRAMIADLVRREDALARREMALAKEKAEARECLDAEHQELAKRECTVTIGIAAVLVTLLVLLWALGGLG